MSKYNLHLVILLLFSLSLSSCENQVDNTANIQLPPFFDIEDYFKKEVASSKVIKNANKTVTINGKKESKPIPDLDLEQELAIFSKSNINKTSWLDKYNIDSTYNAAKQLTQVTYTAKEAKLRTREVAIAYDNQKVSKVEIQNETQNIIAHTQQRLVYQPQKGYTISSKQDILLTEPKEMMVEVLFP